METGLGCDVYNFMCTYISLDLPAGHDNVVSNDVIMTYWFLAG